MNTYHVSIYGQDGAVVVFETVEAISPGSAIREIVSRVPEDMFCLDGEIPDEATSAKGTQGSTIKAVDRRELVTKDPEEIRKICRTWIDETIQDIQGDRS